MSDVSKIKTARKNSRETNPSNESRQAVALEDIADSLEGIRQDLTGLTHTVVEILKQLSTMAQKGGPR